MNTSIQQQLDALGTFVESVPALAPSGSTPTMDRTPASPFTPAPIHSNRASGIPSLLVAPGYCPPQALPPFDSEAEMWHDVINPPAEIVQGLIHEGTKATFVGGSKSFKTWSLMDLGLSVAAGVPWWGLPTNKGRVLYINLEIPKQFARQRLRAIAQAKAVTAPSGFVFWNLRGHVRPMAEMVREIINRIKSESLAFGMVIVDPIYKLLAGCDENGAGEMTELLNDFEKLAVETGAAVVNGTHMSKGNQAAKDPMDRASGSGVIARDPDTMIILTRHEESDAFTVDTVLRNFPPMPSFVIRREHPLMVRADDLDPAELRRPSSNMRPPKPAPTLEMFLGIFPTTLGPSLEESSLGNEQISQIFRERGWSADSIKALKDQAMAPANSQLTMRRLAHNRQLFGLTHVISQFVCS